MDETNAEIHAVPGTVRMTYGIARYYHFFATVWGNADGGARIHPLSTVITDVTGA